MSAWGVAWTGVQTKNGKLYDHRLRCQTCLLCIYYDDTEEDRKEAFDKMYQHCAEHEQDHLEVAWY